MAKRLSKAQKEEAEKKRTEEEHIEDVKRFFDTCAENELENRRSWLSDMTFAEGDQWDPIARRSREDPSNPRPIMTINNVKTHCLQVLNDIRQNRPAIKTRPVSIGANNDVAEVFNGVIRHIEEQSDWETAIDVAGQGQIAGGWGYLRVITEVVDEDTNQQEIYIRPVYNALSVYADAFSMSPVAADMRRCLIVVDIAKDDYESQYGEPEGGWDDASIGNSDAWLTSEKVRVAEHFELKERYVDVFVLETGEKITKANYERKYEDYPPEMLPRVVDTKKKKEKYVKWEKLTSFKVLEESEINCKYIPIVRVPGYYVDLEGKRYYSGLIKAARDPVMAYNVWFSAFTEHVAMAPKGKWLTPEGATDGFENEWAGANTSSDPNLPYKYIGIDGNPIPPPQRIDPPPPPSGILQGLQLADMAIKATIGRYEASLGQQGNEVSGRAIIAKQQEGDTATYHFTDHLSRAVKHLGRILIDMIPRYFDAPMVMRIIGEDGSTEEVRLDPSQNVAVREVQKQDGTVQKIYNLGVGTYDVISTVGPTFATRRQEFVQAMTQIMQANPAVFPAIGDIFMRANDFPGADEMGERMEALLPEPIKQMKAAKKQGNPIPPEVQMQMQQMQQQMEQMQQALQQAGMEGQKLQQMLNSKSIEGQMKQIDLQMKQADFEQKKMEHEYKMAELGVKRSAVAVDAEEVEVKRQSVAVDAMQVHNEMIRASMPGVESFTISGM
jgi:hypothetical protein